MKKSVLSWMLVVAVILGCRASDTGRTGSTAEPSAEVPTEAEPAPEKPMAQEVTMPSGLKYQDLHVGEGVLAEAGSNIRVHYTGWLTDGTKFDSSLDRGQPFAFRLGQGDVIRGWDEGVKGMRVGGKRKLTIPPEMGYGSRGAGPIPPNSTLVFDVELLEVN